MLGSTGVGDGAAVDTTPGGPASGPAPGRLGRALGRVPPAVRLATVLFTLVAALWTVVVPPLRAPDEGAHVDLVVYLAEGHGYPRYDGRYFGEAIGLDSQRHLIDMQEPWPRFDADDAPPRAGRPTLDDLGGTTPDADARRLGDHRRAGYPYVYNQMPQHPPLYYLGTSTALKAWRLLPGAALSSFSAELGLLRLLNVLLVAPLPVLAWATAVRMGAGERAGVVASLLPLALPQLTHIASSVNNDNLLVLLGGVLAVLLAGVARGRRDRRTDLAVGAVLGLALLTKAFALMFVPWIAAAYVAAAWTTRRRRAALAGAVVAGGTGALVGGWWWTANWIREGEPAPTTETLTRTVAFRPEGFEPEPLTFTVRFVGHYVARTWAWVGMGTPKFDLPPVVVALLTGGVVIAVVAAVRRARPGPEATGVRRWDVVLGLLPAVLLSLFVVRRAWGLYETNGRMAFIQGRYLFSTLAAAFAVLGFGLAQVARDHAVRGVLAVAVVLQCAVMAEVIAGSWSGPGPLGPVRGLLAWSPWPPLLVLAVAISVVAAVAAVAGLTGPGRCGGGATGVERPAAARWRSQHGVDDHRLLTGGGGRAAPTRGSDAEG